MVQINIGKGQGLTQAIRDKIGATNIKNSNLETWQKVMTEVNSAQSKDKSIFQSGANNTTDTTKLDDSSTYHSNFVVDEGNIEIDDGVWSRIKALLTGKTEVSTHAKETVSPKAPVQPENKNVTSNEQTSAPKDDNVKVQNEEVLQTTKKYLSAGDLEQCKQMLHLDELPDGVSIAKENGQFLYFKDGKQISFQEVKNLAQKATVQEEVVEPNISENSEIEKPVENQKNEAKIAEDKTKGSELYDSDKFHDLYSIEANKKFLGEYSSYILSSDSNDEDVNKHGYLKSHVAGAMNAIVFLKPSHSMVLDDGGIRIEKNNDNSITIKYNYDDDNTTVTFNQDGSYRSGNIPPDEYSNTFANYVDEYLAGELLSDKVDYE